MRDALMKCPDATIIGSNYSEYREYSNTIMKILREFNTPMRKASIDEAYLDITSLVKNYEEGEKLAIRIKQDIMDKTQLTVSIGIGPTLKIAKMGSDYKKPDGISVFAPDNLDSLFDGLALKKIPGIGKKTAERLSQMGYVTCDQLRGMKYEEIVRVLGKSGKYYYEVLQGESTNSILPRGPRKSISNSKTFHGSPGDVNRSLEIFDKLFEESYTILLNEKFKTKTVGVRIRYNGFETITRAVSIAHYVDDKDVLYDKARELILPYLSDRRGIRLLGVGFYNLKSLEKDQLKLEDFYQEGDNMNSYELLDEFISEKSDNKKTEDVKMKDLSDFD